MCRPARRGHQRSAPARRRLAAPRPTEAVARGPLPRTSDGAGSAVRSRTPRCSAPRCVSSTPSTTVWSDNPSVPPVSPCRLVTAPVSATTDALRRVGAVGDGREPDQIEVARSCWQEIRGGGGCGSSRPRPTPGIGTQASAPRFQSSRRSEWLRKRQRRLVGAAAVANKGAYASWTTCASPASSYQRSSSLGKHRRFALGVPLLPFAAETLRSRLREIARAD